jgi:hypothetical protein
VPWASQKIRAPVAYEVKVRVEKRLKQHKLARRRVTATGLRLLALELKPAVLDAGYLDALVLTGH